MDLEYFAQCPCSGGSNVIPLLLLAVVMVVWALAARYGDGIAKKGESMKRIGKAAVILGLLVLVAVVIAIKRRGPVPPPVDSGETNHAATSTSPSKKDLPCLLDLGAGKCIPCKMMAPLLEELKKEYEGKMKVVVIDVWKDPEAGKRYGIQMIPTQIFFDASGKELYRHVGFFSKEDILAKWKELGFSFEKRASNEED